MNQTRRHDIDALRVLLFSTLILYHVGMLYVAEWPFHLKSSYQSEWLQIPMLLVNRWRMPALFVISGIALHLLHRRLGGASMALDRTRRILVPLLFGMAVVVPIQPYCQGVANHLVEPGFVRFLVRYYRFAPWPKGAFDGWQYGITWNHLWYLAYVWVYSVVTIAALPLLDSTLGRRLARRVAALRGGWLLLLPALPKTVALMTLGDAYPGTNDLFHDWYQHALYFPYFLFGWWIATDAGVWAELVRLRRRTLGLAVFNWIVYLVVVRVLLSDDATGWPIVAARFLSGLNTWLWIAAVLGWSAALLNRPFRWLPYATEAVLPWYVLHQSVLIAVAYLLIPLRIGAVAEPVALIAATVIGCLLLHEFAIRRNVALRFLFGLKPLPPRERTDPPDPLSARPPHRGDRARAG